MQNEYLSSPNLYQSKVWAEFQKTLGREVWRFQTKEATALVVKYPLVLGKYYLYVPRGPLVHLPVSSLAFKKMVRMIQKTAKKENAVFLRMEPLLADGSATKAIRQAGLKAVTKNSPLGMQKSPEHTLIVNLTLSEDELLAQMKPKGRYNIRVAEKHGVVIRQSVNPEDIEVFISLLEELEGRKEYSGHEKDYYRKLFSYLAKEGNAKLFIAEFDGKPINAIMVTYYGTVATYLHGASSDAHKATMAPYLTQWAAIKDAKKQGYRIYDFWGVAPDGAVSHPWKGITEFKLKFGGERVDTVGTWDASMQGFWYNSLKFANTLRKIGK